MGFKSAANNLIGNNKKAILFVNYDESTCKFKSALKVQYNPASIRVSTRAGVHRSASVGNVGVTQVSEVNQPAQINFAVELIFDRMNIQDAFMLNKYTNLSPAAVVSDIGAVVGNVSGADSTIKNEVEALVGMLQKGGDRVKFSWADMQFIGEITSVDATYTMFNPMGKPVRATVSLLIQQNDLDDRVINQYWDKRFTECFGGKFSQVATESDMNSPVTYLQNFLNF